MFIAVLTPLGTVYAVDDASTTTTTENEVKTESTETAEDKVAREKRLKEKKDALKAKLTATQEKRLKERCAGSQGTLRSFTAKVKGIQTSREKVYSNLVNRLTTLQTKLKAQNVDTAELDAEITALNTKIEAYKVDLAAYQQTLADLAAMNCTEDPAAFKASLESARTALQKVHQDAKDIRAYVKDTIKPTLEKLKALIEKPASVTSDTGGAQ